MNVAVDTNRKLFREHTSGIHKTVEKVWSGASGFASRTAYADFLSCSLRAHQTYGAIAAKRWGNEADIVVENERISCLETDTGPALDAQTPVSCMNESYAWGIAYVLNGSCLGASVMMKRGDIPSSWPKEFFMHCQDYVSSGKLKDFFDRLNVADLDRCDAIVGANDCFAVFSSKPRT